LCWRCRKGTDHKKHSHDIPSPIFSQLAHKTMPRTNRMSSRKQLLLGCCLLLLRPKKSPRRTQNNNNNNNEKQLLVVLVAVHATLALLLVRSQLSIFYFKTDATSFAINLLRAATSNFQKPQLFTKNIQKLLCSCKHFLSNLN